MHIIMYIMYILYVYVRVIYTSNPVLNIDSGQSLRIHQDELKFEGLSS